MILKTFFGGLPHDGIPILWTLAWEASTLRSEILSLSQYAPHIQTYGDRPNPAVPAFARVVFGIEHEAITSKLLKLTKAVGEFNVNVMIFDDAIIDLGDFSSEVLQDAINAINEGEIMKLAIKPWDICATQELLSRCETVPHDLMSARFFSVKPLSRADVSTAALLLWLAQRVLAWVRLTAGYVYLALAKSWF